MPLVCTQCSNVVFCRVRVCSVGNSISYRTYRTYRMVGCRYGRPEPVGNLEVYRDPDRQPGSSTRVYVAVSRVRKLFRTVLQNCRVPVEEAQQHHQVRAWEAYWTHTTCRVRVISGYIHRVYKKWYPLEHHNVEIFRNHVSIHQGFHEEFGCELGFDLFYPPRIPPRTVKRDENSDVVICRARLCSLGYKISYKKDLQNCRVPTWTFRQNS